MIKKIEPHDRGTVIYTNERELQDGDKIVAQMPGCRYVETLLPLTRLEEKVNEIIDCLNGIEVSK